MKLLEEMSELYRRKGITVELSGETPTYAIMEMRGRRSMVRLIPGDISEDDLIDCIKNDLVEVETERLIF